jgi:glucokinase
MQEPNLLVGVNAGIDRLHTIIVQEDSHGGLQLIGEHRSWDVIQKEDPASVIERIRKSIVEAIRDARVDPTDLLTIGISSPGQIDNVNGILLYSTNFNVRNVRFAEPLRKDFDCHIAVINDVDAQAVGEHKLGAGKQFEHIIYLFVSYGIGSGNIIDGKLYTGGDGLAGEFGHMTINFDGVPCLCGSVGCLEAYSSRYAMGKKIQTLQNQGQETVLANLADLSEEALDLSASIIEEAIDHEDPLTIRVVEEAADVFGVAIANLINFLNPHAVILGGDVIDEIDLYFERAVESTKKWVLKDSANNVSIVRGALGTTAGAYGAAVFGKQHFEQRKSML